MAKKVVLTGMRTTGMLHLGHYIGALKQWIEIQNQGEHECYFLLADVQALTTHADCPELLTQSVREVVMDWLAVGLDPSRPNVHFVLQSQITERHELSVLLSMIAKYSEVMRNPTLKTELERQENATVGFMVYPVDQVADIEMVTPMPFDPKNELLVPVGEDQVPHLEYARVLAERFNSMYGPVLTPCKPLVGKVGRLVGTDGQAKMSKSIGNTIDLADEAKTVEQKVRRMFTDPKRVRSDVPGETENNPVFIYHRAFNPNEAEVLDLTERYHQGKVGDVEVKKKLALALNNFLEPVRERRAKFAQADVAGILEAGSDAARKACIPVVEAVRDYMHLKIPR